MFERERDDYSQLTLPLVAIVQILIENSSSIGHAPPEVTKVIEAIQGDPLRATRSLETVLESSGSKGHDLPSRYAGGKHKKQRTNSLSGNAVLSVWMYMYLIGRCPLLRG